MLLAVVAGLAAAGCGSDDEGKQLPRNTVAALDAQLEKVQERLDNGTEGACKDILEAPPERGPNRDAVQQLLDGLPNDVDPDVREATQEGFENLWSLVESRCDELKPEEPAQTEPTEPETTTTETETQPTETTPPATETTPTTPGEETVPPDGDGENGGAIPPEGNGNGGGVGPGAVKEKKEKGE
jgi:hypothetical protein